MTSLFVRFLAKFFFLLLNSQSWKGENEIKLEQKWSKFNCQGRITWRNYLFLQDVGETSIAHTHCSKICTIVQKKKIVNSCFIQKKNLKMSNMVIWQDCLKRLTSTLGFFENFFEQRICKREAFLAFEVIVQTATQTLILNEFFYNFRVDIHI